MAKKRDRFAALVAVIKRRSAEYGYNPETAEAWRVAIGGLLGDAASALGGDPLREVNVTIAEVNALQDAIGDICDVFVAAMRSA